MVAGDFTFARFARNPWYQAVNAHLVDLADVKPGQRIVDLACGPGSVTKLILDKVRDARDSVVIGVDISAAALKQAREDVANASSALVQFMEGQAEDLSRLVREKVDAVVFCNAIHMVEDKDRVVQEVSESLRPGGIFAFNSSFFNGELTPETSQFYRRWMMRALRILKKEHNLSPSRDKVMSRQTLTIDEYSDILKRHGFKIATAEIQPVDVPLEGWQDISYFEDFIVGAMPGVPLKEASHALVEAAAQIFREFQLSTVRRDWLSMVAIRQ